jgi:hypothetical protein
VGLIVHRNCDIFHIFTVFDHRFHGNGIIVTTVLDAGPQMPRSLADSLLRAAMLAFL